MKKVLFLFAGLCLAVAMNAAITVTGVVTSSEDGQPVIGASVMEKGTTNGTITDLDGVYALVVSDKATLEFSYVGMKTKEVRVTGPKHDVVLSSDAIAMEEVVVTAMGVVQEKKRLNFAVQSVNSDVITEGKQANFIDALQGKIAGVNVTTGGGSPNSGSNIVIRGVTSISSTQSNDPLIVMDGMPLRGSASDINPADIENVTVLKGAAASALYGQDAANGVIMITTKSAKLGKVSATVNAMWEFDTPNLAIDVQDVFLPGSQGFYKEQTMGGWGPVREDGSVIYDNVRNYFNDYGFYHKYDLNVSGGTEKFNAAASASYSKNDGIVPNDYREKITALVKATFSPNKYVSMGLMANIIHNNYRGSSGISQIYYWPINDDITNYQHEDGTIRFLYYSNPKQGSPFSSLYSRYNDYAINRNTRSIMQGHIKISPVKGLDITGRLSMDQNNYHYDSYSIPRFSDQIAAAQNITDPYLSQEEFETVSNTSTMGSYYLSMSESRRLTANVMAQYHADLPHDFGLDVMLGAEWQDNMSLSTRAEGQDFIVPGVYSMKNIQYHSGVGETGDSDVGHYHTRKIGVFGEIRADYKGLATLSVTSRFDWSSCLDPKYNPYWYPSITAGLVFSELIPGLNETSGNWFSFGKIRGNFAMVGKDCPPYLMDRRFTQFQALPDGGYSTYASLTHGFDIKPEISTSWEVGADLRFLDNRLRFDMAYYSLKTENQIVTVRVSLASGDVLQTRNEGTVANSGMEFTLEGDIIKRNGWLWTAGINIGYNRGKVLSLPDGMEEIEGAQYGDIYSTCYLGGTTTAITGKDYLRTADGTIICDENGYPQINPTKSVLIGNREPKCVGGLSTSLSYKGFSLGILFDGRVGGDIANITRRSQWSNGMHPALEYYRGRQVVWDGVVQTGTDANGNPVYEQNTKPIVLDATTIGTYFFDVSSNFVEDGSYVRLKHVNVAYSFAPMLKKVNGIDDVAISFTATNLATITKYTGSDPQINASPGEGGVGSAGIDNYAVPSTRGYNISLKVAF